MPLPHLPDGPEKPFPLPPAHEQAPAAASPQTQLLTELWRNTRRLHQRYQATDVLSSERGRLADSLGTAVGDVSAVLHHLYGMSRGEATERVQRALKTDQGMQALL